MRHFLSRPLSITPQRPARIGALILVLAATFLIYLNLRTYPFHFLPPPLALAELTRFKIRQLDVGLVLQLTIVPIILICLPMVIPYFRRLLRAQAELGALHAQSNLPFLFNVLNTPRYMIRTDRGVARARVLYAAGGSCLLTPERLPRSLDALISQGEGP